MKDIYEQYAEKKLELAMLQKEVFELEGQLLSSTDIISTKKHETDFATFMVRTINKYIYSRDLVTKETLVKNKIKSMKKEEELNGTAQLAQSKISVSVVFKDGIK